MKLGHLGNVPSFCCLLGFLVFNGTHNLFPDILFYFLSLPPKNGMKGRIIWMKGRKELKISRGFEGVLTLTSFHVTKSFCDIFSAVNEFTSMWFCSM